MAPVSLPTGSEKRDAVQGMFDRIAPRYDLLNRLVSLGLDQGWRRQALDLIQVGPGDRVVDLACGTGDLTLKMSPQAGPGGLVIASDINASMLQNGRDRLTDKGIINNVQFVQADAEKLPFPDNSVDRITIAFGLRNVTNQNAALSAMYRCLRPGGRLVILEFSKPVLPGLDKVYDLYSFKILPQLGKLIANDEASYRYLAESIRKHPGQETLKDMMASAGFDRPHYHNLSGGIVAVHKGYKA
jgi:demethylmenaquinone methyltransferase/2-methoxy-6-polyprenyl-1,4-benzoquinol methylase